MMQGLPHDPHFHCLLMAFLTLVGGFCLGATSNFSKWLHSSRD
jgi:hypothetical protein